MHRLLPLAIVAALSFLFACGDEKEAPFKGLPNIKAPAGTIVAALSDFNEEIYVVGPDGRHHTRLTNTPEHVEANAVWSPDGQRLAFIRRPLFGWSESEVIVVNADGSHPVRAAGDMPIYYFQFPAWSPDGSNIAFLEGDLGHWDADCYGGPPLNLLLADVNNLATTFVAELTAPGLCFTRLEPKWSPDGSKIALAARGVYLVDVASGRLVEMLPPDIEAVKVAWSPNSQSLTIAATKQYGGPPQSRILTVNADGNGLAEIVQWMPDWWISDLAWSPDGSRIAFSTGEALFVVNIDGSGLRSLVQSETDGFSWSPDGHYIAFSRLDSVSSPYNKPVANIYTINVDDGSLARLTDAPTWERRPSWSPSGTAIAFASGRDAQGGIYAIDLQGTLTPMVPTFDREPPQGLLLPNGQVVASEQVVSIGRHTVPVGSGVFSPDGRYVAHVVPTNTISGVRFSGSANDIYIMNSDGSRVTNVTNTPDVGEEEGPVWSPKGNLLAFTSWTSGVFFGYLNRLEIMKADGSGRRIVADFSAGQGRVAGSQWSPDGRRLYFVAAFSTLPPSAGVGVPPEEQRTELYTVKANGSGLQRLLEFRQQTLFNFGLSPDSSRLAIVMCPSTGHCSQENAAILVVKNDGTDLRKVARGGLSDIRWSPDSSRLAFLGCEDDPCRETALFVVNADGSGLRKVTTGAITSAPIWSPDGAQLAFITNPDPCGPGEGLPPGYLEVINADGTGHRRLTERCIVRSILGWAP